MNDPITLKNGVYLIRKEFHLFSKYLYALIATLLLSYSVYFLGEDWVNPAGQEDGIFEYLTALFFLSTSITFGWMYYRNRKMLFLLMALILFVGCGEEISWGQRLFGFGTPDILKEHNVQGETTLHNIEILNSNDFDSTLKTGWRKIITVDFLYKLFCMGFGIVLPIMVCYIGFIGGWAQKLGMPVPALLLGSFFMINWLTFKFILSTLLPDGKDLQYYDTVGEIAEFVSAVVFFVVALAMNEMENMLALTKAKKNEAENLK